MMRQRLVAAAARIAENRGESPADKWTALRKIFIQERRDWKRGGVFLGWKRGEIFEWLDARTPQERASEWGDIGYYVAQSFAPLWWLYAIITRREIIRAAVEKFEERGR